jgi:hypothetical protein
MKNFSDLLDTDQQITVSVNISPLSANGDPTAWIKINDCILFDSVLMFPVTALIELPLLDPLRIEIGISNKNYNEKLETAVVINSVNINGFEIVPAWTNLASYQNDHANNAPTSYLGFNGTWVLEIPEPFYRWQHHVTGQGCLLEPVLLKNNTR